MAEKSGFFDAHLVDGEYDRIYLAESFAKYFASFIGNGIFGGKSNELMVQQKATADMSVRVLSGQAWINGYWYENTSKLTLKHVKDFEAERDKAGIKGDVVSPKVLPTYYHGNPEFEGKAIPGASK